MFLSSHSGRGELRQGVSRRRRLLRGDYQPVVGSLRRRRRPRCRRRRVVFVRVEVGGRTATTDDDVDEIGAEQRRTGDEQEALAAGVCVPEECADGRCDGEAVVVGGRRSDRLAVGRRDEHTEEVESEAGEEEEEMSEAGDEHAATRLRHGGSGASRTRAVQPARVASRRHHDDRRQHYAVRQQVCGKDVDDGPRDATRVLAATTAPRRRAELRLGRRCVDRHEGVRPEAVRVQTDDDDDHEGQHGPGAAPTPHGTQPTRLQRYQRSLGARHRQQPERQLRRHAARERVQFAQAAARHGRQAAHVDVRQVAQRVGAAAQPDDGEVGDDRRREEAPARR